MRTQPIKKHIAILLGFFFIFFYTYSVVFVYHNSFDLFTVHAESSISLDSFQSFSVLPGETQEEIKVVIKNNGNSDQLVRGVISGHSDIEFFNKNTSNTVLIPKKSEAGYGSDVITFTYSVKKNASAKLRTYDIKLYDSSGQSLSEGQIEITIGERSNVPGSSSSTYIPSVDMGYQLSTPKGITAGQPTDLTIELFNWGNTLLKDIKMSITLPEGISVNNGPGTLSLGYMMIGDRTKGTFSLIADKKLTTKNYPIAIELKFKDQANIDGTLSQTFYIPVNGKDDTEDEELSNAEAVEIFNMVIPAKAIAGEKFSLSFDVTHKGEHEIKQLTVTAEMPEGVINTTKNVFALVNVQPGSTHSYQVQMITSEKAEEKYYPIKITAQSKEGEKTSSFSQYTGIYITPRETGTQEKTPQILVSDYSFGGSYVQAGDVFNLNLQLFNASNQHNLRNIKVSVKSDDGTFVPVGSSNSFFIDSIGKKKTVTHAMRFSAVPEAEQKTKTLTVSMAYEDMNGNAFSADDVISIPVMQETRLVVDEIIAPPELYVGMPGGSSVGFYNMGKTVLNNLRVDVKGDFSTTESNLYYVGNMEAGKSDSFDFSYIPNASSTMTGTIIFTYEDAAGKEITYERPFEFMVMDEIPDMGYDPGEMDEMPEEQKKTPWILIGVASAAVVSAGTLIILKKRKKRKLEREMDLNE